MSYKSPYVKYAYSLLPISEDNHQSQLCTRDHSLFISFDLFSYMHSSSDGTYS